jgi:hypothetical protein
MTLCDACLLIRRSCGLLARPPIHRLNRYRSAFLLAWFALFASLGLAHAQTAAPLNPRLTQYIDSLDQNDQRPYQQLVRHELSGDSAQAQSTRVYRQNYGHLLRIIRAYGYPSFALVGPEAVEHFNNMVFHCAFAPAFQQRALRLFTRQSRREPALRTDKRYLHDVAYLTDKITFPQVYGTQMATNLPVAAVKSGARLRPTRDMLHLDERRRQMQLEPVADYLAKATALNRQMNPKFSAFGQFHPALKRELDSLYARRQLYERLALTTRATTERDSVIQALHLTPAQATEGLRQLLIQTDSTNLTRVRALIEQYGYPGKTLVGTPTNEVAFQVLQASTRLPQYLPLLEQVAQQGEVPFRLYALMLDRHLMREGRAQVYGTQGRGYAAVDPATGQVEWKMFIWPVADPAHVNDRRKQAGFTQTVQENAARLGIVYQPISLNKARRLPICQATK